MNLSFTPAASDNEKRLYFAKQVLKNNLKFEEDRLTGLNKISITIRKNPDLSNQIITNSYNSIINFYNDINQQKATEKKLFIEKRVLETEQSLRISENNLKLFLQENSSIKSPMLQLEKERLEREVFLFSQVYLNLFNQLETSKIDENDSTSTIFLLDTPQTLSTKSGMDIFRGVGIVFLLSYSLMLLVFFIRNREKLIQL